MCALANAKNDLASSAHYLVFNWDFPEMPKVSRQNSATDRQEPREAWKESEEVAQAGIGMEAISRYEFISSRTRSLGI